MKRNKVCKISAVVMFVVFLSVFYISKSSGRFENNDTILDLQAPPFVVNVQAKTLSAPSVISEEAGISAWYKATTSIDLSNAKNAYRTIEYENNDYILGSVGLENYPESEDVHVYVHKDGWILAYYLAGEPAAKIFDWQTYHNNGRLGVPTKLENAIIEVADSAGVTTGTPTFYDFRHPNATNLMLIIDWVQGSGSTGEGADSFDVNLPGEFVYYERSWSLGTNCGYSLYNRYLYYRLNGIEIKEFSSCDPWEDYSGPFTVSQLGTDEFHTIEVESNDQDNYAYGGLALIYGAP